MASFTLRPLYSLERTHWIRVCMSSDDVAFLFFVGRCVLTCVLLRKIWPGLRVSIPAINCGKQFHRNVASSSKARVLLPACKQAACFSVRRYTNWSTARYTNKQCWFCSGYWTVSYTTGRLELQWTKSKLSLRRYRNKGKSFFIISRCYFGLKFLDHKSLLQLFLNCKTFVIFLDPSSSFQKKYKFFCPADWLALSCTESSVFSEKDRRMGLTKIESYCIQNLRAHVIFCVATQHMWPP